MSHVSAGASTRESDDFAEKASTASAPFHELLTELACITSRCSKNLLSSPMEPSPLSLEVASEALSPLALRVTATRALTIDDLELDILQPWSYPYRLVRIAIRLPEEFASVVTTADWSESISCLMDNIVLTATLVARCDSSTGESLLRLPTVLRSSCTDSRYCRCMLVEIPLPAGVTLSPAAAITLTIVLVGSSIALRIPATGHVHTATCNHENAYKGAVWEAASAGDAAAVEAALAAGGSTEERDDEVRYLMWRSRIHRPLPHRSFCTAEVHRTA